MDHTSAAGTPGRKAQRDLLAFDRSDRWGLAITLALIALGAAVVWVVEPIAAWAGGSGVPLEILSPVTVPQLDSAAVAHGLASYDVELTDPSSGQRLLAMAPGLLSAALVILGCWLVVRVMRRIAEGDPFDPRNVSRLRGIAGTLVLGAPVVFFVELSVRGALLGSMDLGGLDPAVPLSIPWKAGVAGMVVALLAEAFKAGNRLRDDVEGLV